MDLTVVGIVLLLVLIVLIAGDTALFLLLLKLRQNIKEIMTALHNVTQPVLNKPSQSVGLHGTIQPGTNEQSQETDMNRTIARIAQKVADKTITLDDYYPINPIPRYGHGRPSEARILKILEKGIPDYKQTLESFLPYSDQFLKIAKSPNPAHPADPAWINGFFPGLDSVSLFGMISTLRPKVFLEIGSGNSTRFAAKARSLNSPETKIISIDPFPRVEIDKLCDEVIRSPLESVDLSVFEQLSSGDILFIDGSHRVFQNSDVTVCFIEILPSLKSGVYVHLHDIVWPDDYPPAWKNRYYSEQYMLALILLFASDRFKIILPNSFIAWHTKLSGIFEELWSAPHLEGIERHGCSFWLRTI